MTYKSPNVSVYQILTRVSQTLADSQLYPCLVGPLYQVVTNQPLALSLPVTSAITISYPNLKIGAVVNTATVSLTAKNAVVEIVAPLTSTEHITSMIVGTNNIVADNSTLFANVSKGDKFILASGGEYTINAVSSDFTTLAVVPQIYKAAIGTPLFDTFKILRSYTDDITINLSAPIFTTVSFGFNGLTYQGHRLVGGICNVSYVALRKDLTGFYEVNDLDTLRANIDIDPKNPLGFYLGNIMLAANGGRKIIAYIIPDNLDLSYLDAFEDLAIRQDTYFIVPMSTSTTVINGLTSHVATMSSPENSYFRSGIVSANLVTEKVLTSATFISGTPAPNNPIVITRNDSGVGFLAADVRIGSEVFVTSIAGVIPDSTHYLFNTGGVTPMPLLPGIHYDQILVTEIVSESSLKFAPCLRGIQLSVYNLATAAIDAVSFNLIYHYSKDEQVDLIIAKAQSLALKRILSIWPPKADWNDGNNGIVTFDGTALAAALSAAMSSYAAQQSFTNLPFAGPKKLYYSNDYFNKSQLKRLSGGGVFVLVQDAEDAQIYSRHQVSTSTVSVEEQEFSITKAVDKFSIDVYSLFKPFIGKYNIDGNLLTGLADILDTYAFAAQNTKAPYCGSLILSCTGKVIRANLGGKNTDLPKGTTEVSMTIEVGYPNNFVVIKIYVS